MANLNKSNFKSMTKSGLTERDGYTFSYELADGTEILLGIYKTDGKKPCWTVIDLKCGMSICNGATRAEAAKNAENMREKYTEYLATPKYAKYVADFEKALGAGKPKATSKPKSIRTTTASLAPSDEERNKKIAERIEKATGEKVTVKSERFTTGKKPAATKKPKAPAKPDETAALKKRIAELEAELAEAKKPVADAAATVSLTELCGKMQGWCSQHPNTCATYIPKPGAVVKVHGVLKEHEAWQKELAGMGFRWAGKAGVWYFGEKEAAKLGKVAVIA